MQQPDGDLKRLEKILDVFQRYQDHREKVSRTRDENRRRHEPKARIKDVIS